MNEETDGDAEMQPPLTTIDAIADGHANDPADPVEPRGRKPVQSSTRRMFSRRIMRRLAELQMSQQDLADASGITKDAVSTYCRGRSLPTGFRLRELARALRMDERQLLPERFPQAGDDILPPVWERHGLPPPPPPPPPPGAAPTTEGILFQMTVYVGEEQVRIVMDRKVSPRTANEILRLLKEEEEGAAGDKDKEGG